MWTGVVGITYSDEVEPASAHIIKHCLCLLFTRVVLIVQHVPVGVEIVAATVEHVVEHGDVATLKEFIWFVGLLDFCFPDFDAVHSVALDSDFHLSVGRADTTEIDFHIFLSSCERHFSRADGIVCPFRIDHAF